MFNLNRLDTPWNIRRQAQFLTERHEIVQMAISENLLHEFPIISDSLDSILDLFEADHILTVNKNNIAMLREGDVIWYSPKSDILCTAMDMTEFNSPILGSYF